MKGIVIFAGEANDLPFLEFILQIYDVVLRLSDCVPFPIAQELEIIMSRGSQRVPHSKALCIVEKCTDMIPLRDMPASDSYTKY